MRQVKAVIYVKEQKGKWYVWIEARASGTPKRVPPPLRKRFYHWDREAAVRDAELTARVTGFSMIVLEE